MFYVKADHSNSSMENNWNTVHSPLLFLIVSCFGIPVGSETPMSYVRDSTKEGNRIANFENGHKYKSWELKCLDCVHLLEEIFTFN